MPFHWGQTVGCWAPPQSGRKWRVRGSPPQNYTNGGCWARPPCEPYKRFMPIHANSCQFMPIVDLLPNHANPSQFTPIVALLPTHANSCQFMPTVALLPTPACQWFAFTPTTHVAHYMRCSCKSHPVLVSYYRLGMASKPPYSASPDKFSSYCMSSSSATSSSSGFLFPAEALAAGVGAGLGVPFGFGVGFTFALAAFCSVVSSRREATNLGS